MAFSWDDWQFGLLCFISVCLQHPLRYKKINLKTEKRPASTDWGVFLSLIVTRNFLSSGMEKGFTPRIVGLIVGLPRQGL